MQDLRTSDGYEIDLVLELARDRWAIEVKLTSSPDAGDLGRLAKGAGWAGATRLALVSRTRRPFVAGRRASTNLRGLLSLTMRG